MTYGVNAAAVLRNAIIFAGRYDRDAKGEVLFNPTRTFHLCGLIERAGSSPKSGAAHARPWPREVIDEAKAAFCRAHKVPHPSVWEWEQRRSPDEVREALLLASETAHGC